MSARDILSANLTLKPEYLFYKTGTATLLNATSVVVDCVGVQPTDIVLASIAVPAGANGYAPFTAVPGAVTDKITFTGTGVAQTSTVNWAVLRLSN